MAKNMNQRLEKLIELVAPDTLTLRLEDGQTAELTRDDLWDAFVEVLSALREDRYYWETESLTVIAKAVPGQHSMADLIQALLVSMTLHQQKQMERGSF
ncbi:MAG: hypothetical protein WBJ42_06990 [Thermovirgaceae bacterium]|nr:hypothetical protein [Synergistales bacterium]HPC76102.1 hypothetical protein [Synergistales bacterium]HRU90983.1 hypothetical protein [Thermovirgaceae bacterium]